MLFKINLLVIYIDEYSFSFCPSFYLNETCTIYNLTDQIISVKCQHKIDNN